MVPQPPAGAAAGGTPCWLARHAAVCLPEGLCYGASDVPADPAQTDAAAAALAVELPQGVALWVSALGRAGQLAQALGHLRPDLGPARVDPRLNEMDFGRWELRPWQAIGEAGMAAWMADFEHHRPGGGESLRALLDRVHAAAQDARAQAPAPGLVWITHAGVIRAWDWLAAHGPEARPTPGAWPREAPAPGGWVRRWHSIGRPSC